MWHIFVVLYNLISEFFDPRRDIPDIAKPLVIGQPSIKEVTTYYTPFVAGTLWHTLIPYVNWSYVKQASWNTILCNNVPIDVFLMDRTRAMLIIITGLKGDKNAHYVKQLLYEVAIPYIYNVAVINANFMDIATLEKTINTFKQKHAGPFIGIGYSAGANQLCRLMASYPDSLDAGISIANAFDVKLCADKMPWYLKQSVEMFDNLETDEGSHLILQDIQKPLVCINSLDDPCIPHEAYLPVIQAAKESKTITAVFTQTGGHIGWVEGVWKTWLHRNIVEYLRVILKHN